MLWGFHRSISWSISTKREVKRIRQAGLLQSLPEATKSEGAAVLDQVAACPLVFEVLNLHVSDCLRSAPSTFLTTLLVWCHVVPRCIRAASTGLCSAAGPEATAKSLQWLAICFAVDACAVSGCGISRPGGWPSGTWGTFRPGLATGRSCGKERAALLLSIVA